MKADFRLFVLLFNVSVRSRKPCPTLVPRVYSLYICHIYQPTYSIKSEQAQAIRRFHLDKLHSCQDCGKIFVLDECE